jgi:FBP C-terminal treble-clef zinc-finger
MSEFGETYINHLLPQKNFAISSEQELIFSFRPRDQKKLIVPKNLRFPLDVNSYFRWKESSGVYTYLIFKRPNWDAPCGVAFKRSHRSGEPVGGLCNWCHSYGTSEEIGLLSVQVNSQVSLSYFICQDLRCIEKIEENAALDGRNPDKLIQQLYYRIEKLFEGLSHYNID